MIDWHRIPAGELEQLLARPGLIDGERSACGTFIVAFRPRQHPSHTSLHELFVRVDRGFVPWVSMLHRDGLRRVAEDLVLRRAS